MPSVASRRVKASASRPSRLPRLAPRPRQASVIPAARDGNADMVDEMADRSRRLAHGDGDFAHERLGFEHGLGDALGEGFDQVEHGLAGEALGQVAQGAIVDRVGHQVGAGGLRGEAAVDIDIEFLAEILLRVVHAVKAVQAEIRNEYPAGHQSLSIAEYMSSASRCAGTSWTRKTFAPICTVFRPTASVPDRRSVTGRPVRRPMKDLRETP